MNLCRGAKLYSHEIFTDELTIYKTDLILKVLSLVKQGSLPGLSVDCFPLVNYLVSFPTYSLPWVCTYLLANMGLEVRAFGRSKTHYGLTSSSDF